MIRKRILFIIAFVILVIIIYFCFNNNSNYNRLIEKYMDANGFTLNEFGIYSKSMQSDNGEVKNMFFDVNDYVAIETIETKDEYNGFFKGSYDYKEKKQTFYYEISYNNAMLVVSGDYDLDSDKFICNKKSYTNVDSELEKLMCDSSYYYSLIFYDDVIRTFKKYSLMDKFYKKR